MLSTYSFGGCVAHNIQPNRSAHKASLEYILQPQDSSGRLYGARISKPSSGKHAVDQCGVCHKSSCQLRTHREFLARRRASKLSNVILNPSALLQSTFVNSYAYRTEPRTIPRDPGAHRINGFHNLPIPGGDRPDLHNSVWNILHNAYGTTGSIPLPTGMTVADIRGLVLVCAMSHPSVCFGVLASEPATKTVLGEVSKPSIETACDYREKCMYSMRQQLNNLEIKASRENILALAMVYLLEIVVGTPKSLHTQIAMINRMVDITGGLSRLGFHGVLAQQILWIDQLSASYLGTNLHFKDIQPIPPVPASFTTLSKAVHVLSPVFVSALGSEVYQIVTELRILLLAEKTFISSNKIASVELEYMLAATNHNTVTRIQLETKYQNTNSVDECIIIAINILCHASRYESPGVLRALAKMSERLIGAIKRYGNISVWDSHGRIDIILWISFVAATVPLAPSRKMFFTSIIAKVLDHKYGLLWPLNWQYQIRLLLQTFLWLDLELLRPFLEVCQVVDLQTRSTHCLSKSQPITIDDERSSVSSSSPNYGDILPD